jgi:hypothetical protein
MKFKVLIAAIILGLALPVAAQFRTVSKAHEVRLSELRLPQNDGGTVGYKPCDTCPYETKRVSSDTQWVVDGKSMSLDKFKRSLMSITDRRNTAVTVLQHLESDRVTRVSVHPVSQAKD